MYDGSAIGLPIGRALTPLTDSRHHLRNFQDERIVVEIIGDKQNDSLYIVGKVGAEEIPPVKSCNKQ